MSFFPREQAAPAEPAGPIIAWEETNCLLCGSSRWSPLVEARDNLPGGSGLWFVVVRCHDCGLCFTNPRPSPDSIGQFYPTMYRPHRLPNPRKRRPWLKHRAGSWQSLKRERWPLPWHGEGRLLDFGCGGGSFLNRMHRQGWQVTGLDVSAAAVHQVQAGLGLPALVGTLPHPELPPESFDVITMWHSLEHVHHPLEVLRQAYRLLAPGGKLVVATPNIDSLPFRWFRHAWYGLDLPRHLIHFAPWTLQLMLERSSFHAGPICMVPRGDWMRWSARLACHAPRGPCWQRWLTAKPASRFAAWYSYWTQQSDCILVAAEKAEDKVTG